MARPTHDEIIRQLSVEVALLNERVAQARDDLREVESLATEFAVLKQRVDHLEGDVQEVKRGLEEGSRKRWALLPPIIGAIVNVILAALVSYFVARR